MEITVSGKNKKLIKLVEKLAKELGLSTKRTSLDDNIQEDSEISEEERSQGLYELMEEMAQSGAFQSIKDPGAWQREIREDKPLYGRE